MQEAERASWLFDLARTELERDNFTLWLCFFHGAANATLGFRSSLRQKRLLNDACEDQLRHFFDFERAKMEVNK